MIKDINASKTQQSLAITLFQRIERYFHELDMTMEAGEDGKISLHIPIQSGIGFSLQLSRRGDELFVETDNFKTAWAPLEDSDVREIYLDIVIGLINGDYQIMETYRGGICISSRLQTVKHHNPQQFFLEGDEDLLLARVFSKFFRYLPEKKQTRRNVIALNSYR